MDNNNMIPAAPVAEKSGAKKSSGLMIATVLFGISTIALGTTLAIKMMNDESGNGGIENKTDNKCIVTQDDVENLDEGEVSEIIASYNSDKEIRSLVEEVRDYAEAKIGSAAPEAVSTYDDGGVLAELEEGGYISLKKSYGINVNYKDGVFNTTDAEQNYSNTIVEFLTSKGFGKNEKMSFSDVVFYDNGNLRCRLNSHGFPLSLSCSDTTWVKDEDVALANALLDAYGTRDEKDVIVIDRSKMKTSDDGNYEGIQVSQYKVEPGFGIYALYYHEIGADEWTFVVSGNGISACSKFENVPKGLFPNAGCLVDGTNDVVKVNDL